MPPTGAAGRGNPNQLPVRAFHLLAAHFNIHDPRERRAILFGEFGGDSRIDLNRFIYSDPHLAFLGGAVAYLASCGCTGRGRHYLSLLLTATANIHPALAADSAYRQLLRDLDAACALPFRPDEERYLARLIDECATKARVYAPLKGNFDKTPSPPLSAHDGDAADPEVEVLIRHVLREHDAAATPNPKQPRQPADPYSDILDAFGAVPQAALLGEPGSGKSTTLRKLAVNLATAALADTEKPIPLLAALGEWRGDETLADFLSHAAPEIGWAVNALGEASRLIVLLDGLNEVPTGKRAGKAAQVRQLRKDLAPGTPFYVSCRQKDYAGDLDLALDTLTLEPLTPSRIRAAVERRIANENWPPAMADQLFWQLAGDHRLARVYEKYVAVSGADADSFWSATANREFKGEWGINFGEFRLWRQLVANPAA
jgi:NACHT domain